MTGDRDSQARATLQPTLKSLTGPEEPRAGLKGAGTGLRRDVTREEVKRGE